MLQCFPNIIFRKFDIIKIISKLSECKKGTKGQQSYENWLYRWLACSLRKQTVFGKLLKWPHSQLKFSELMQGEEDNHKN